MSIVTVLARIPLRDLCSAVTADPDGNRLVFATSKDAAANPSTAH